MNHGYDYDVVVIGAGPAGLACAIETSSAGANTLLLDEQPLPGGQIYRSVECDPQRNTTLLDPEYQRGARLVKTFRESAAEYLPGTAVWNINPPDRSVFFSRNGRAKSVTAREIVIATGAIERAVPIPGWTLPGVMSAGGTQVLLKSSGIVPQGRVVLAGSGPLLLLVAVQLLNAGVELAGVAISTRATALLHSLPNLPGAMLAPEYLLRGLRLFNTLHRCGVPVFHGAKSMAALGRDSFSALTFEARGEVKTITADLLLLHEGVIPNTQFTRLIGTEHKWIPSQSYWSLCRDMWGKTSVEGVSVAGDGARIDGARAAQLDGRLCGLGVLNSLGSPGVRERNRTARYIRIGLIRHRAIRPYLDKLFAPPAEILRPQIESTLICRCSEVTVSDINDAIAAGCDSPDQVKSRCRAGMGPCQGRTCGTVVSAMVAQALDRKPDAAEYYKVRPPIKPLTLAELATLQENQA